MCVKLVTFLSRDIYNNDEALTIQAGAFNGLPMLTEL